MTVRDLITKSFRFVHILGAGEAPNDDEANDGLEILNELIELTSIVKLLAFFRTEILVQMVPNKFNYTVGPASAVPTPDIIAPRPVQVLTAFSRRNQIDLPVYVASKRDYDNIQAKFTTPIAGWEQAVYYEASYPVGSFTFYQVPVDNLTTAHLIVSAQLTPYATLDEEVALPPGYFQWLRFTLGEYLAPEYGFAFTPAMTKLQVRAEGALKRNNSKPLDSMGTGLGTLGKAGNLGGYNIYSDTNRWNQ